MATLRMVQADRSDIPALESFADHTIFQTDEWSAFLTSSQAAEPITACLIDEGKGLVGRFTGQIVRKLGARMLGSPFPGWMTAYMGFNLAPDTSRVEALHALARFAFHDLGCLHMEIMDRGLSPEEARTASYPYKLVSSYEVDLAADEETVFGRMSSACRRNIRKAARVGVCVEEATDRAFVDEYYDQLEDVFAKQDLVPTYTKRRVHMLLDHLLPTGRLLLLRALSPDGLCIATGIFPAMNDTAFFWGGASYRSHQILRPNEAIQWYAMRYWQERGMTRYDMGAGGYKRKYGGELITVPWIRKSRYGFLEHLRNQAQRSFKWRQRILGRGRHSRQKSPASHASRLT